MSEEIEQLIRSHAGTVVVHLTEPILHGDPETEGIAAELGQWGTDISVVHAVFSLHRDWARKYRVHGTPCTLVFRAGELRLRAKGRYGRGQLHALLEQAGLLEPL